MRKASKTICSCAVPQWRVHTQNATQVFFWVGCYLQHMHMGAGDLRSINLLQDARTQLHFSCLPVFKTQNEVTLSHLCDS